MRFSHSNGEVLAERIADGQKFSLRPWQYEMMRRFDGVRTYEAIAREVHEKYRGEFSPVGLTNFYQWLYDENLVLCECDSIFELVTDDDPQPGAVPLPSYRKEQAPPPGLREMVAERFNVTEEWQKQAIKISAMILVSLAILRIAYIAAPIFEPPVNHLYSSIEGYFYKDATPLTEKRLVQPRETPIEEMELAGRAMPQPVTMPSTSEMSPPLTAIPEPEPYRPTMQDLENLRRELAECRIRRDEFYIQNNEIGYRYEVQKMTALTRQIGEVEALLD